MPGLNVCLDGDVSGPTRGLRGSGVLATESRDIGAFSSVSVGGGARLILERTGTESLTITAAGNILTHLTAEVVGGRLGGGLAARGS